MGLSDRELEQRIEDLRKDLHAEKWCPEEQHWEDERLEMHGHHSSGGTYRESIIPAGWVTDRAEGYYPA